MEEYIELWKEFSSLQGRVYREEKEFSFKRTLLKSSQCIMYNVLYFVVSIKSTMRLSIIIR